MNRHKHPLFSFLPLLVAALTIVAFLPVLRNGYVDWDDSAVLLANPNYRGLGWAQLGWMFTTFYMSLYRPVAWATLGFDYRLWGMNPAGYHATSLLFHAANAALVYAIALRLYRLARRQGSGREAFCARLAAAFAALFFSLHPLTVEPVAWASARSDPVAAFFIFVSTLCYLRAAENGAARRWLLASWAAYALSLGSKAAGAAFPIVLLALDFYPLRRLDAAPRKWFRAGALRIWCEKIPFVVLSIAAAVLAVIAKERGGVLDDTRSWANVLQSAYALLLYLGKIAVPQNLSPFYSVPSSAQLWSWPIVAYPLLVGGLTIMIVLFRHRWPALSIVWLSYLAFLLPVSGIVKYGAQFVADRYAYLPIAVCAIGIGALALSIGEKSPRRSVAFSSAVAVAILLVLASLTWRQTYVWRDSESLFRRAIAVAPESVIAHHNLAVLLAAKGRTDEALEHYKRALASRNYPDGHFELGNIFSQQGKIDAAVAEYREAIRLDPLYFDARLKLAMLLIRQGRLDEAAEQYRAALKMEPSFAEAHNNLGLVLASRGKIDEAIAEYRAALKIKPNFALAHVNLGDALLMQGKTDEAIAHLKSALEIDPNLASARRSLDKALGARQRR